ncbi:NAD-dependent epimerase/dehydratase family protein [Vibrio lentus]|uniref:NAD-dependent epimerase/dehydratase family protein n=1 Tax=Vibrio lentus TaxID=136468 RepID=UPI000C84C62A|nr:NAD-dependent epimerase/dehydratase family protein [Vibrio lentus]PMJ05034.1 UDP-glucose 4-epimerase [Vibrio lentus]PMJ11980.1 UDP-glucose 4-epimerase [Vibrio lentus]
MNILLTGSSGFIGKAFMERYPVKRKVVRGLSDSMDISEFPIVNLDKKTSWVNAFDDIDTVIHLAGLAHNRSYTEMDYQSINVSGTLHLARQAAISGVKRFVFVSSIGVNGTKTNGTPFSEKSKSKPHDAYSQSKCDAEVALKSLASETGLEVVIVRPTLVYGPGAPGNFGSLAKLIRNFPLLPFALTCNRRSFISVQNLCDLLFVCATHPKASGHTFLASDGEPVSTKEFTNTISVGMGCSLIQCPVPIWIIKLLGKLLNKEKMVQQLVGDLEVDSSNLKHVLDWDAPCTMKQSMSYLSKSDK